MWKSTHNTLPGLIIIWSIIETLRLPLYTRSQHTLQRKTRHFDLRKRQPREARSTRWPTGVPDGFGVLHRSRCRARLTPKIPTRVPVNDSIRHGDVLGKRNSVGVVRVSRRQRRSWFCAGLTVRETRKQAGGSLDRWRRTRGTIGMWPRSTGRSRWTRTQETMVDEIRHTHAHCLHDKRTWHSHHERGWPR